MAEHKIFKSKIKAVVFDVGGVLASDAPKLFMGELSIKRDFPVKELLETWRKFWADLKLGKITEEEFWYKYAFELVIKEPADEIIPELKEMIRLFLVPKDDVLEYAKSLKEHFKLGILSNSVKEWVAYSNDHYKIDEEFDAAVYSCDEGKVKPQKEFFHIVLDKLELEATQCIYVDNHDRNVEVAKELGFHAIKFENLVQLQKDIDAVIAEQAEAGGNLK